MKRMNLHQSLSVDFYFIGTIKHHFQNLFSAYFIDLISDAILLGLLTSKYMNCKHSSAAQCPTA